MATERTQYTIMTRWISDLSACKTPRQGSLLLDRQYTYDPSGNITTIRDNAQSTVFFRNRKVDPTADYIYDAIYRLIQATGREHLGQVNGFPGQPSAPDPFDTARTRLNHPGDGNAMETYLEECAYDEVALGFPVVVLPFTVVGTVYKRSLTATGDSRSVLGAIWICAFLRLVCRSSQCRRNIIRFVVWSFKFRRHSISVQFWLPSVKMRLETSRISK
jgi:hypothetical protein